MAKIYVGNLTYELEPRDLENEFARFGKVEQCAVKHGFAFIHFQEARDAEAAVQEMDNQDWRGRRMKVAFATSTGDGAGRPAYGSGSGGGGGGGDRDRGGGARESGDAPVSQNLFVANIPPHLKMSELEAFFEQFGPVQNVKILPQARGSQAMSAFVDFTEVADAKRAFEADLVIDGQHLRSDYNIRRGERREFSDRGGGDRGGERRDSWGGDRGSERQNGGGMHDDRRTQSSRDDFESHRSSGSGSSRRDRSRSPIRQDRGKERRGSGGSGGDRYEQRRDYRSDRSPPRSVGGGGRDRDYVRKDDYQQPPQRERQPRSPPRGNGRAMDPHARMNGNDGSYANGSRGSGDSDINRY
ncbi:Arginine serine-rich-splicing factor rsp40-like [Globisporangium polare]